MILDFLIYLTIRTITFPFAYLPISWTQKIGNLLGTLIYLFFPKFRKRCFSNLALANTLHFSEKDIKKIARESLQNLCITCLEYAKFSKVKRIQEIATCLHFEKAAQYIQEGQGVIFFCAHQSNWEILFLEGTSRMPGVAIGRPIKNTFLYNWILSIRQKFGGTMIPRANAAKEGLRAIKQGKFLGIVGDQGMPDSPFHSLFFGRLAWTSPLPAILSYRTGCPVFVATTKRENHRYIIEYSEPILPSKERSLEEETDRIMKECLSILERSIQKSPGEWLWSHNRWKQQTVGKLKREFRYDSIAILLPQDLERFSLLQPALATFATLYPREFITVFVPKPFTGQEIPSSWEKIPYEKKEDLFVRDFRFKLVFNFTGHPSLSSHFRSLSALDAFSLEDLQRIAKLPKQAPISEILTQAICKCP